MTAPPRVIGCPRHPDRLLTLVQDPLRPGRPYRCQACVAEDQAAAPGPPSPHPWILLDHRTARRRTERSEALVVQVGRTWWAMVRRHDDPPGHVVVGSSTASKRARQLAASELP
ncbi:hypothetical protein L6R53_14125 [Myxococcota bacterium]|nr:hypothetical protein [Myxococcota bacterium]